MKFITLFLQAAGGNAQQGGSMGFLLMIILIFVVMWLFMIRPQQKKQKEVEKFREGLKKGDKVVTIGGIYGTVVEVKEKTLILEVDQNVKIKAEDMAGSDEEDPNTYDQTIVNVSVTPNGFLIFWANRPLRYGIIGGLAAFVALFIFLLAWKRKKEQKR